MCLLIAIKTGKYLRFFHIAILVHKIRINKEDIYADYSLPNQITLKKNNLVKLFTISIFLCVRYINIKYISKYCHYYFI